MQITCPTCNTTRIMPDGLTEERILSRQSWLPGYTESGRLESLLRAYMHRRTHLREWTSVLSD